MNSVTEKKQGRRTAQEAEQTKKAILKIAAQLFCRFGYKKVSLRQISEQANVSHSLLRYHFGSKEKIWQHISDHIYQYFQEYFQYIIDSLPQNLPANVQLYMLMNRVLACSLHDSRAIIFLADAVRQEKSMVNYFLEPNRKNNQLIDGLIQKFKQDHPDSPLTSRTLRWQASMYYHTASTLEPLMLHAFESDNRQSALFAHWQQFNRLLASQLYISNEYIESPSCLDEIIVPPPKESNG
ncbi:TetR/AcrR family transcriptional regulator [Vibrio algivorus]|uniref:TetR/AcrR family transcriptional regulator n=1 Tax=Vibrio algivorus TaxID=1667024 RepID=UPI0016426B9C|nr:TetR/AcrR family transcriptional regulator [Vibrio algivorus]